LIWLDIYSTWPDIQLFSVSGIRLDIRQVKSGIRPDTGNKKRPDIRCIPSKNTPVTSCGIISMLPKLTWAYCTNVFCIVAKKNLSFVSKAAFPTPVYCKLMQLAI
jgi:hypothetical protein